MILINNSSRNVQRGCYKYPSNEKEERCSYDLILISIENLSKDEEREYQCCD
jgi:hypothetical protein